MRNPFILIIAFITLRLHISHADMTVSPIRPMYECDPIDYSIMLSDWYLTCKKSCSPTAGWARSVIDIYVDSFATEILNVYAATVYRTTTESHTDLLDNCRYSSYVSPLIIHDEDVQNYKEILFNQIKINPHNNTLIIEDPQIPECSYFRDNYVSYDTIISQKYKGQIIGGTSPNNYILSIPALGVTAQYKEGAARLGSQILYWNISGSVNTQCTIKKKYSETCKSDDKLMKWWCPSFGGSISLNESAVSTCAGTLLPVNHGVYVELSETSSVDSRTSIITGLISSVIPGPEQQSLILINKAIADFSNSICESVCDLTDQSASVRDNTTSVIETPIGPWLAWRDAISSNNHIYYMTACRRVSDWTLSFPLNPCPKSVGMTIHDNGTGLALWDPAQNYFIIGQKCNQFIPADWYTDIKHNKSITIHFWGKKLLINPPYSWQSNWEDSELHIHRSSKWTPYVDGSDIKSNDDMLNLLDSTHDHIRHIARIVQADTSRNLTIVSKFINGLKDIGYTISNIGAVIHEYTMHIFMFIFKVIGFIVALFLLFKISWYLIQKAYRRNSHHNPNNMEADIPSSSIRTRDSIDQLIRRRGMMLSEL
ncbi:G [Cereal chlorotic mottle virus]|uniref:G n=1 Tax=Cereal chlorotic mottle virus TaxID=2964312 RepID=A0A976X8Y8_9RHAB|nr:G [Cereal chlorotic mottle virus] [Cereal chlorotic mottle virus]